jgi:Flp pilus assembly protein TadG
MKKISITQNFKNWFNRLSRGQIIGVFTLMLPAVILFMGLGIDAGLMYHSKAQLSRAVDSTSLRVARRFDSTADRKQNLALLTMRANYKGFCNGANTWSATGLGSNAEVHTINDTNDSLEMDISADPQNNDVINVNIIARVTHKTLFMRLAGEKYANVHFSAHAKTERFPAVNALILDISGSMRGNGGAASLPAGVLAFINEFNESRDYLLLVTFSTYAKPIFPRDPVLDPDEPSNDKYFPPSKGFLTGKNEDNTDRVGYALNNTIRFAGATNAAEGLRLAFEQVDHFLSKFENEEARSQIRVNYIFFTDGEFNTFRGFAKGLGYGIDPFNPTNENWGHSFGHGNPTTASTPQQYLPSIHNFRPLMASRFYPDSNTSRQLLNANNTNMVFNNYSQSTGTNYNLKTLVSDRNPETIVGVNSIIQGYRERNAQWRLATTGGNALWPNSNDTDLAQLNNWSKLLWSWSPPGNITASAPVYSATPIAHIRSGLPIDTTVDSTFGPYNTGTTAQKRDRLRFLIENEKQKLHYDHSIYYPEPIWNDPYNPTKQAVNASDNPASGIYVSTSPNIYPDYNMTNLFLEYYPGGRAYANFYGGSDRNGLTGGTSLVKGGYLERTNGQTGSPNGANRNLNDWNYGFCRLSDYYPYYTFGGPAGPWGGNQPVPSGYSYYAANTSYSGSGSAAFNKPGRGGYPGNIGYNGTSFVDPGPGYETYDTTTAKSIDDSTGNGQNDNDTRYLPQATGGSLLAGYTGFSGFNNSNTTSQRRRRVGPPWYFWSFRDNQWVNMIDNNETRITQEGNFLAEAQAFIARKSHNATIYTILYQSSNEATLRRMANEQSNGNPFYTDQKTGKYYRVTDGSDLTNVFRDIARRITVRISE